MTHKVCEQSAGPRLRQRLFEATPTADLRTVGLIKRSRAAVSQVDINSFFDNYEKVAAGVAAENVFNYDETNLQENPGKLN
jgi:hypothetical protein